MENNSVKLLRVSSCLLFGCVSPLVFADSATCTVSSDGLTNNCTGAYTVYEQSWLNY